MFETMRDEARDAIVKTLRYGYEGYGCEIHNEVFNKDHRYTSYNDAETALIDMGVFDAIKKIIEYERDNFGEVTTDFSGPCAIGNMLWYIIGEEELYAMFDGCSSFDEFWNEEIGETECKVLLAWLEDNDRI